MKRAKVKQKDITNTDNIPNRFPRKVTKGKARKTGRATLRRKPHAAK